MYTRKEGTKRVILEDGTAVNIRVMDSIMIEDLMIQHAQGQAWRIITGQDLGPIIKRDVKDYLIKLYAIT